MIWFACVLALILEGLLPERYHQSVNQKFGWLGEQCEVHFDKLGMPNWQAFQWWVPLALLMGAWWLMCTFLQAISIVWVFILQAVLMLFALRFAQFTRVFTPMQLFINQGDLQRAKEILDPWLQDAKPNSSHEKIDTSADLMQLALQMGTQKGLSQCFSVLFWFLCLPNGVGVVLLLLVQWSERRCKLFSQFEKYPKNKYLIEQYNAQHIGLTTDSLVNVKDERQYSVFGKMLQLLTSPEKVQFVMEWLPTRLWGVTLAVVSQFDEILLAWKMARNEGVKNNAQLLYALCMAVVWPNVELHKTTEQPFDDNTFGTKAMVVQHEPFNAIALQNFRQLMLRSVIAWVIVFLLVELWSVGF